MDICRGRLTVYGSVTSRGRRNLSSKFEEWQREREMPWFHAWNGLGTWSDRPRIVIDVAAVFDEFLGNFAE